MSDVSDDFPRLRPVDAFPVEVEGRRVVCLRDPEGLAEGMLMVPPELLPILAMFDGQRSILDIQAAFTRQSGTILPSDRLYVGVRGEARAPIALFDGDSLIAEAALRIDGVHDFIAVPLRPGPHLLRIRMESSWGQDRKSTRLNSSHSAKSRMPSSA